MRRVVGEKRRRRRGGGRWAVGWTSVSFYELGIGDRGGIYGRMSGDSGGMDGFFVRWALQYSICTGRWGA